MSHNLNGSANSSAGGPPGGLHGRRPSKWSQQIEQMLSQGRRNSAAMIIGRLRSGSLTGWTGGGSLFPGRKATFDPSLGDDVEAEYTSKKRKKEVDPEVARMQGNASMGSVVSALYAKLLVVMGIGFPLAEVISSYIPPAYYDGFYLYLYFVSILFMTWIFANVIKQKATREISRGVNSIKTRLHTVTKSPEQIAEKGVGDEEVGGATDVSDSEVENEDEDEEEDGEAEDTDTLSPLPDNPQPAIMPRANHDGSYVSANANGIFPYREAPQENRTSKRMKSESESYTEKSDGKDYNLGQRSHFGSFYLRIGAVAFGIGSMIYSGLEFGQYFELEANTKCHNYMVAITPAVRMIFTFMQMYFIFLNSRMAISKVSLVKQFGLMHMIGTNLCVWLLVLVQETKHEITHFYDPENRTITLKHGVSQEYIKSLEGIFGLGAHQAVSVSNEAILPDLGVSWAENELIETKLNDTSGISGGVDILSRARRGLKGPHSMYDCGRANIIGSLVDSASPFLFPCTIEYSLICAAVCYVMWKSMAQRRVAAISLKKAGTTESLVSTIKDGRSPHHYSVDCTGSNKGFFFGIFFLVMTIMSLILNFVFMKHHDHVELATFVVNITEVILYSTSILAVLLGMCRLRKLRYDGGKNLELDNILLIVAQSGSFVFNVFCIIGGHLTIIENDGLVLIIPILCLIQLCLQTLFILDASKRVAATDEHRRKKPGREILTFLLITNLAMWLVNALEKSRGNSHPYLLHFYGVWAWTIITRISMPLAIFYRFHSTVCLCEVWKKAYKIKHER